MGTLDRLGLLKTSLIDYPGEVAAVVFTAGCNLRCPYCHNPGLVSGSYPDDFLPRAAVLDVLSVRADVLTGVCITGGEPLVHEELGSLIESIRGLGLKVKLDTNGMLPQRLEQVRTDFVALDLKVAPGRYRELGGPEDAAVRLTAALDTIRRTVPAYELRTTVVPGLVGTDDVDELASLMGTGEQLVLAPFRPGTTLDPRLGSVPPPDDEFMARCIDAAARRGVTCRVRERE